MNLFRSRLRDALLFMHLRLFILFLSPLSLAISLSLAPSIGIPSRSEMSRGNSIIAVWKSGERWTTSTWMLCKSLFAKIGRYEVSLRVFIYFYFLFFFFKKMSTYKCRRGLSCFWYKQRMSIRGIAVRRIRKMRYLREIRFWEESETVQLWKVFFTWRMNRLCRLQLSKSISRLLFWILYGIQMV